MAEAASQGTVISWQRKAIGAVILLIVGAIFFQFFTGRVMTFTIMGESMAPTLHSGDKLFVSLRVKEPFEIGDLVVFNDPRAEYAVDLLIKRVVALPGDTVTVRNGRLRVNGIPEFILGLSDPRVMDLENGEFTIPEGMLYVLGDNRDLSFDSTEFGPLQEDRILGKATYRFSPWNQRGSLD